MKQVLLILINFLIFPIHVLAHGPTPQKAKESIVINASVDKVWNAIKVFDDVASWHGDIKKSAGDGMNVSGGTRTLTFQNDEVIVEELDYFSDQDHEYSYRLKTENVKALPVSSYSTGIQVTPGETENTSTVTIKSRFYRGDTGNTPPEQLNDKAAVKAMTQFYKNGLNSLKQGLEN